ncbi:glycine cleavage system protein R [Microbacterium sp. C7(2022)]|uniref:glycine cleavage system protein R n=1 Tax=Microbacterium sp. C7(2022) TaxID=2992759 RepID=UPI00237C00C3|nr:ACT domain-containing protein [Microbacterium sp. C7(2022)]MDE0545165.1 amino acid-binding ACT protein [Microbacterium sp. C7(2022)]
MTTLVLTVVGDDRAGLVASIAGIVEGHGGNWENSQLAELAGTFAGVIEVSVVPERADELRAALDVLEGLLTITAHTGGEADADTADARAVTVKVLGNDRAGIVRDVSSVFSTHDVSIDSLVTQTKDAAMAGGRLFEATVEARVPASIDLTDLQSDLERLAHDIQVDVTIDA